MPTIDFSGGGAGHAEILIRRLPTYDAPYAEGHRTGCLYEGDVVRLVSAEARGGGEYLSAQTDTGDWINVWALRNRAGRPRGILYAAIRMI